MREKAGVDKKSPVVGPGSEDDNCALLPRVPSPFQAGYSLSPFTLTAFATTTFAWLFVAFLELQTSEQAIVLNLLLEHLHGPLKVIINDLDLQATKLSQIPLPFLSVTGFVEKAENPDLVCSFFKNMYNTIDFSQRQQKIETKARISVRPQLTACSNSYIGLWVRQVTPLKTQIKGLFSIFFHLA